MRKPAKYVKGSDGKIHKLPNKTKKKRRKLDGTIS